jgi:hypothetical protein
MAYTRTPPSRVEISFQGFVLLEFVHVATTQGILNEREGLLQLTSIY